MKVSIISGGKELLSRTEPMWEKLKSHHVDKSVFFAENMSSASFNDKINKICLAADEVYVNIAVANNVDVGYCITVIDSINNGEIKSLYVDSCVRRFGIGSDLMNCALNWLRHKQVGEIILSVAVGNEEVNSFYERFGFQPKLTILQRKP